MMIKKPLLASLLVLVCAFICPAKATDLEEAITPIPGSPLFYYDDIKLATGLHVSLSGETKQGRQWQAREIRHEDLSLMQRLMTDAALMQYFAAGYAKNAEQVEASINHYTAMGHAGYPLGGLTILLEHQPVGHIFCVEQHEPGVAEIGYIFDHGCKNSGLASAVVQVLTHQWAPELHRIACGQLLDPQQHSAAIEKFKCFQNSPLKKLVATASPANVASWMVLKKNGFRPAAAAVRNHDEIIVLPQEERPPHDDRAAFYAYWQRVEKALGDFYSGPDALQADVCYFYLESADKVWVFSQKTYTQPGFQARQKIKFHFELNINTTK
ncbi:MAG: GNAT family N-acetyltransferase [Holosporales bacterium]